MVKFVIAKDWCCWCVWRFVQWSKIIEGVCMVFVVSGSGENFICLWNKVVNWYECENGWKMDQHD